MGTGQKMVIRGGSWNNNDNNLRVANRNKNNPTNDNNNIGFRCVQQMPRYSAEMLNLYGGYDRADLDQKGSTDLFPG